MNHYSEAQVKSSSKEELMVIMGISLKNKWESDIKRINEECQIRFGFTNYVVANGPAPIRNNNNA